jgi:hypothetical protein
MQPDKKYFKRGDLAAVQQQEYMQKYGTKVEEVVTEKERIREEKVEEKKRGKRYLRSCFCMLRRVLVANHVCG